MFFTTQNTERPRFNPFAERKGNKNLKTPLYQHYIAVRLPFPYPIFWRPILNKLKCQLCFSHSQYNKLFNGKNRPLRNRLFGIN